MGQAGWEVGSRLQPAAGGINHLQVTLGLRGPAIVSG